MPVVTNSRPAGLHSESSLKKKKIRSLPLPDFSIFLLCSDLDVACCRMRGEKRVGYWLGTFEVYTYHLLRISWCAGRGQVNSPNSNEVLVVNEKEISDAE